MGKNLDGWFSMEKLMQEVVGPDIPPQNLEEELSSIKNLNVPIGVKEIMKKQIEEKWKQIENGDKKVTKETPYWEIDI